MTIVATCVVSIVWINGTPTENMFVWIFSFSSSATKRVHDLQLDVQSLSYCWESSRIYLFGITEKNLGFQTKQQTLGVLFLQKLTWRSFDCL